MNKRNAIQCLHCGETIESTYTHDLQICKCGKVGVDGGPEYLKRIGNESDYKELSVKESEDNLVIKNAYEMRRITKTAISNSEEKDKSIAKVQLKSCLEAIEREAQLERFCLSYRNPLSNITVKTLKELGYKVRDDGEGVANLFMISWEE